MNKEKGILRNFISFLVRVTVIQFGVCCIALIFHGCETTDNSVVSDANRPPPLNNPDSDESKLKRARDFFGEGEYEAAIPLVDAIIDRNWGATEGLLSMVVMEGTGRGNNTAARELLEEANQTGYVMTDALLVRGMCLWNLKRYDEAMKDFRKITELRPSSFLGYYWLGATYYYLDKYDKAEEYILKARAISPRVADIHNLTGYIHLKQDRHKEAEEDFTNAILIRGHFSEPMSGRAEAKWNLGKKRSAIRDLTLALSVEKKAYYLSLRGWYRASIGEFDEGLADMNASIEVTENPGLIDVLRRRAWLNYGLGNFTEAAADFTRIIQKEEDLDLDEPSYARLLLAITRLRLNQPELAADEINRYQESSVRQLENGTEVSEWFNCVVDYLFDRKNETDIFALVDGANPPLQERLLLEGNFYVAQKFLIQGDTDKAVPYLEKAFKKKDHYIIEDNIAAIQLKNLKVNN